MDSHSRPLLGIVCICKDNPHDLQATLNSIAGKMTDGVQVIIVDGSTRSTSCEEVARRLGFDESHERQTDRGIYDAMNLGLDRATADSVLFLNSGDTFEPEFRLDAFLSRHRSELESHLVLGRGTFRVGGRRYLSRAGRRIVHQATFFPRAFYGSHRYDTSFQIAGDREYIYRAMALQPHHFVDDVVCSCDVGGISTVPRGPRQIARHFSEVRRIGDVSFGPDGWWFLIRQLLKWAVIAAVGPERTFVLATRIRSSWTDVGTSST